MLDILEDKIAGFVEGLYTLRGNLPINVPDLFFKGLF